MTQPTDEMAAWHRAGSPIRVIHPDERLWERLLERATTVIRDGGYTEIPAGTTTTCAWLGKPPNSSSTFFLSVSCLQRSL